MVQILFWVPTLTEGWWLPSTNLIIVSFVIIGKYFRCRTLLTARHSACRIFLWILQLHRSQFLVYSTLIATSDETVLWRWIFDAGPSLRVLSVICSGSFHTKNLCLSRISCLFELIWSHDNWLIWGRALSYTGSWATKLGTLSECRSAVWAWLAGLGTTTYTYLWISLRE